MSYQYRIHYHDGRVEEILPSPRARIETEQHFGGLNDTNVQQATFYLAWSSLAKAGREPGEYNAWLDSVADVEEFQGKKPDPTQPTPPTGTSSG